eukprot:11433403-Heterocapsa_arctica.AAC.1
MNRFKGSQAALIGSPYNYPGEPMTGFLRSCPPGPGLAPAWSDIFLVPIVMIDIPTRVGGISHSRKEHDLPDNPRARSIIWELQKGLYTTGCIGSGDPGKGLTFGSLRVIASYRKDVDELICCHVPRDENWQSERTMIRQYIKVNGHQSLRSLSTLFNVRPNRLLGGFSEYSTAVSATGHTCAVAIAALDNDTAF